MKATCTLIASVVAASSVALSSSASAGAAVTSYPSADRVKSMNSGEKGRFAPKFDGLRFIETLITAHR
ncbi:hypothetical protein C2S52_003059 [Perilla frutescens var. hirtella]|uniref:Uncharacterized protein n=1 Tax=Perilla frutescens var. hirtella TaxID=608512 RepID=A0AAD4JBM4_PERFH|nr:hypothetical protein C2S51_012410 [Perilla frutescens var. frutescens]KAH6790656.1 hypothetical protein C2S51_005662 [Perilla frutescens var. frutescens]KAH6792582.1 hypothetical protein C2S52_003059 [Perilla frutescens var. hirtella]KAH6830833.1 hypothetical protein C2S53_004090 [Perilla frutescens var. hirtella]